MEGNNNHQHEWSSHPATGIFWLKWTGITLPLHKTTFFRLSKLLRTLLRTAPLIHRIPTPGGLLKRAKYCLRGLAFARDTNDWFDFLQAPEMGRIVHSYPCLFHKLQRPYLNRTLPTSQRLGALKQHYQFVLAHFSEPMIEQVFSPAGMSLANFQTDKAGMLELRLFSGKMQKEGDLTICLANRGSENPISTLSFSVWKYGAGHKEMFIGGLQGEKNISKETIVSLTRGLYGLRPKALLFYTLQQLAACWEITRLQAVSDNLHVYRHFQSHRNVSAVYDDFWIECGGTLSPGGTFDLPVMFVPREISSLRVNKRQMYKRRYAMLNEIAGQIRSNILADAASPQSADNVVRLEKDKYSPDGDSIKRAAVAGS